MALILPFFQLYSLLKMGKNRENCPKSDLFTVKKTFNYCFYVSVALIICGTALKELNY